MWLDEALGGSGEAADHGLGKLSPRPMGAKLEVSLTDIGVWRTSGGGPTLEL